MSSGGYDPKTVEPAILEFWERGGYFDADAPAQDGAEQLNEPGSAQRGPAPTSPASAHQSGRKPYVIDIPPPNVTGALHLGHALNNTCQDILIRRARMQGFAALWMPGTDHAGIATQAVVEKRLKEEQGLSRFDVGREGLVERIWKWKDEYNARIIGQLRRMGFSCDWRRTRFTLDEICAKAVYEAFFEFFKAGLIYRGLRLVNWDAALQTAVADDEIEHKTVKTNLWHIRYPVQSDSPPSQGGVGGGSSAIARATAPDAQLGRDYLAVATTRPETMLADTAVAVHPDDERYQHLIGKHVLLPLMNRPIPVIADSQLVKREFGTGCVKVTPGHDPNDHACWQRHLGQPDEFAIIDLLTPDGKINENGRGAALSEREALAGGRASEREALAGGRSEDGDQRKALPFDYSGMKKEDARKKVVADLEALGLLDKIEPYETEVGHSDRSKAPIEPLRSEQWFMRMSELAEPALEAVRDGRVQFFPERYAKTYLDWLGEKRDWCISRQLWWGHRIPVWTLRFKDWERVGFVTADAARREIPRAIDHLFQSAGWAARLDLSNEWAMQQPTSDVAHVCCKTRRAHDVMRALADAIAGESTSALQKLGIDQVDPDLKVSLEGDLGDLVEYIASITEDADVLDTWFSSALWPISTLGWPDSAAASDGQIHNPQSKIHNESAIPNPQSAIAPAAHDFGYFFPTDVLCTGRGIITLWVARMVLTSLYFTKRVPFSHVYIHPIVLDGHGRIMSKSKGNGVDPLDLVELFGTDALRFTLAQIASETQDVRMPVAYRCPHCASLTEQTSVMPKEKFPNEYTQVTCGQCKKPFATQWAPEELKTKLGLALETSEKFEPGRNFITKVWQATTGFILPNLAKSDEATERPGDGGLELEDRWILSRLQSTIAEINRRFDRYQFNEAANALYSFFWNDFCDWYLELVKPRIWKPQSESRTEVRGLPDQSGDLQSPSAARSVLAHVLDQFLRLLHPIAPFVTEALWQRLNETVPQRDLNREMASAPALITAAWPQIDPALLDPAIESEIADLQNVIRGLRDIRTSINVIRSKSKEPAVRNLPSAIIRARPEISPKLKAREAVILRLAQVEQLEISPDAAKPTQPMSKIFAGIEVYVPLAGLADASVEVERLKKESGELRGHFDRLAAKLANEGFVAKAPAPVIEKERARLAEMKERLETMATNLAELNG